MNIVILGGGTVGTWIAGLLCQHRHSVTVVDVDGQRVKRINERLDVRAVTGSAAESSVLFQAGVLDADVCLAVTGSDEVNLIAASMAKEMGARRTVARVYAPVFRDLSTFDYQRHFRIDRLMSLEQLSAMEFARKIRQSGSIVVENMFRGEIEVQELEISAKTDATGIPLKDAGLPRGVRVGSILRNGDLKIAGAADCLEVGDRITLIGTRGDVDEVKDRYHVVSAVKQGIVIAGGGETGYHLARILDERRFGVVVMESSAQRCQYLAERLKNATIVHSDCTRKRNLEEERVGSADVFVACTGDDEDNILAGVEAHEIGAKKIMAVVSRPDYANIVGKLGIDFAVSPREVMAKQVLGLLHSGAVVSRSPLAGGGIDIMEVEVLPGAAATEHVLANLDLPSECLIAAVMREDYVKVPGADDHLRGGDTVVALVAEAAVEDMLRVFNPNGA